MKTLVEGLFPTYVPVEKDGELYLMYGRIFEYEQSRETSKSE
jgi:hypothetical protein